MDNEFTSQQLLRMEDLLCRPYGEITTLWVNERFEYAELREKLLAHPIVGPVLKKLIGSCPDLKNWIAYRDRRLGMSHAAFVLQSLEPVYKALENSSPDDDDMSSVLASQDPDRLTHYWSKANASLSFDPEAAITASRSLLESVCKKILDDCGTQFDDGEDLMQLYKKVAKCLNLEASTSKPENFASLARQCASIVHTIGSIRNDLGDAHGKTSNTPRPGRHHAQFAVTVAGAAARFLLLQHDDVSKDGG